LKDGRVVVAIEKERITRVKHDGGNDNAAVSYCLRAEGIKLKDLALVVQNANFDMLERKHCAERTSPRIVDDAQRVVTISHHLAHAFSTVGTAPFHEMTALVIDGCGNCYADCMDRDGAVIPEKPGHSDLEQLYFEKDSYYEYRSGKLRTIYKDFSPAGRRQRYPMYPDSTMHSIGGAYLAVSKYVFRGFEDPGKLMGLAPYGRSGRIKEEMFDLKDGRVFLNYPWMDNFDSPVRDESEFKKHFQYFADIAWWAQREIERAIIYVVTHRYQICPSEYLSFSGGVALNAVANRLIKQTTKFSDVYFQPAAGDNGLALGCAFYGWLEVLGEKRIQHNRSSHFGRRYMRAEIETTLKKYESRVEVQNPRDIIEASARLIADKKVIGWFQGGSEFGPRALGHRSILALASDDSVREFINSKVKFREDFRPFAPSVLAEEANVYFNQNDESPYMILVSPVREEWRERIPAVVHCDGSARVQTVHREITPEFYRLHEAIKRITGVPILLNTSLNRKGMPIVETPKEALDLLLETSMDALVIEGWLILKRNCETEVELGQLDVEQLFGRIADVVGTHESVVSLRATRFAITGIRKNWTFDQSKDPVVQQGDRQPVAYSVTASISAISEILRDPRSIPRLCDAGQMEIVGCGDSDELRALSGELAHFMRLGLK
jgi:carbamoyltransferase